MDGPAQVIQIPGYADALRRESDIRRQAFTSARHSIAGVRVRPLTLRDMSLLEEMRNGFFCPWRFDDDAEYLGHCVQLVWWLSDCPKPSMERERAFPFLVAVRRAKLIASMLRVPAETLARDVRRYLSGMFMDSPRGSDTSARQPLAATPAYVFDTLSAAGYPLTLSDVMDMPLTQLWQLLRLAQQRLYGAAITNPSDKLATDYIASINTRN